MASKEDRHGNKNNEPQLVKQRVQKGPSTPDLVTEIFVNVATSLLVSILVQGLEPRDEEVSDCTDFSKADNQGDEGHPETSVYRNDAIEHFATVDESHDHEHKEGAINGSQNSIEAARVQLVVRILTHFRVATASALVNHVLYWNQN